MTSRKGKNDALDREDVSGRMHCRILGIGKIKRPLKKGLENTRHFQARRMDDQRRHSLIVLERAKANHSSNAQ